MRRFFYLTGKAFGLILRRPIASIGTLLSLFLLFFLFDLVWVGSLTVNDYYDRQLNNINVEIFLQDSLTDSGAAKIQEAVAGLEGVDTTEFISREDARARLFDLMGTDILQGFEENPLPRSIVVTFKNNYLNLRKIDEFKQRLQSIPGITQIFYARNWLEKSETARAVASRTVLILGAIILLAAMLNLVYSVRLAIRTGEYGIRQLALMGAGRLFLAFPFIFDAVIFVLLAVASSWVVFNYVATLYAFQTIEVILPSLLNIIYFCLGAGLVGLAGGYIGSRRLLG